MKILLQKPMLILTFLFCAGFSLHAQTTIKGVVLNKEATKYFQAAGYDFMKVANDGTTKPINGYKMFYNKKTKSILISKAFMKRPAKYEKLLRGGAQFFCTGCEEELCVIEKAKKGVGTTRHSIKYDCIGCYKNDGREVELCDGSMTLRKAIYKNILK